MKSLRILKICFAALAFCLWLPAGATTASPQLEFSRYFGGSGPDGGASITADEHGHIFITGETFSPDLPVQSPIQPYKGNGDAYVAKFDANGSLLFATFLGGSNYDRGHEIVIDPDDNIYICGWTSSADFPVRNALQSAYAGNTDAFVAKIDAQGQLVFSTYVGGSDFEEAKTLAIDSARNIIVAGRTASTDYPVTPSALDSTAESIEGFLTSISADGSRMLFSTYLGGSSVDVVRGIATGPGNRIFVVGETFSPDFPIKNAYSKHNSGSADAFLAEFLAGGVLVFSTYIGGSQLDRAWGVAVAASGSVYIAGETRSADFPTVEAIQNRRSGPQDAFICRFGMLGKLQLSTYLGGRSNDLAYGISASGDTANATIAITGRTSSPDFPLAASMGQTYRGGGDGFIARLRGDCKQLLFSTYAGGSRLDTSWGVKLLSNRIVAGGRTTSSSFPSQKMLNTYRGTGDAFIVSIALTSK